MESFRSFMTRRLSEMSPGEGDYTDLTKFIRKEKEGDITYITKKLGRKVFTEFSFGNKDIVVTNEDEYFYVYIKEENIFFPVYFLGVNYINAKTLQVGKVAKHPGFGDKAPRGLLEQCYVELSKDFTIWSDETQYQGARKLWCRLTKLINVDFYNFEENKVIEKNVKIDDPNDPKYWSEEVWDCVLRIKKHK